MTIGISPEESDQNLVNRALNIPPPDDFERRTVLRSWLASMNDVPMPASFEQGVLDTVHKGGLSIRFKVAIIMSSLILLTSVTYLVWPQPEPVRITHIPHSLFPIPHSPSAQVNLHDLPPAPVTEMQPVGADSAPKRRRLHGVAGY